MSKPRLYVLGNVTGPGDFHIGDEATLEANLLRFRQFVSEIELTVPSRDPRWTTARYAVDSIHAQQNDPEWLSPEIAAAVRDADGVVICGGDIVRGCPEKIVERVALVEHASNLGRPVVVLGQTLSPDLSIRQRTLFARALTRARWVGVRDEPSVNVALSLGVAPEHVHLQLDDAFYLEPVPIHDERMERLNAERRPLIMVTLDASFEQSDRIEALESIATQLDALADALDAVLVFVSHCSGPGVSPDLDDGVVIRTLSAQLRAPLVTLNVWHSGEARWLVSKAAILISTQQHSLVFATAAGVPAIGIYSDVCSRTKLRGTLRHAGLDGWSLSLRDATRDGLLPLALELWRNRDEVKRMLAQLHARAWPEEQRRWAGICAALELHCDGTLTPPHVGEAAIPDGVQSVTVEIDETAWREYDRKGYMRLGRVLHDAQLDALLIKENGKSTTHSLVVDLLRRDLFREICGRQYGRHANISFIAIEATRVGWHQDGGERIGNLDRDPFLTLWIALETSTIELVPGSHRLGILDDETVEEHGQGSTEPLKLDSGDAVLVHNWMIRRCAAPSRALAYCYMDGRTLDIATGERFPTIFGENQDTEATLPFLEAIRSDNQMLRETAEQATMYATSLVADRERLEQMRLEAEAYARSLEKELARVRGAIAQVLLFVGALPVCQLL